MDGFASDIWKILRLFLQTLFFMGRYTLLRNLMVNICTYFLFSGLH